MGKDKKIGGLLQEVCHLRNIEEKLSIEIHYEIIEDNFSEWKDIGFQIERVQEEPSTNK